MTKLTRRFITAVAAAAASGLKAKRGDEPAASRHENLEDGGYRSNEQQHASQLESMARKFDENPDMFRAAIMGETAGMIERRKQREAKKHD